VHLSRAALFSFACLFLAGVTAAQTLALGPEVPLEIPARPALASNVRLASIGEGFAALWETDAGELVSTLIDAGGQLRSETTHLLAHNASAAAIAGNASGAIAVWGDDDQLVWRLIPSDGSAPTRSGTLQQKGLRDFHLTVNARDFILVWRSRDQYPAVRMAMIGADAQLRQPPINLSTDPTAGPASVAGAGANFFVSYRTSRGIETDVIDANRIALTARRITADVGADPIVVATAAGPVLYFSLPLNGFTDDAATYRVDPLGQPEFLAYGKLLHAFEAGGAPVLVVRNDGGAEIVGLPLRFTSIDGIAWNGAQFLIAAGSPVETLIVADREGELLRRTAFASLDRFPLGIATAGSVALVRWSEFRSLTRSHYARFRDGRMLDAPQLSHSDEIALASDGTSTFLVAYRDRAGDVYAELFPAGESRSLPPVRLGKGEPARALWDGQDFVVLWLQPAGTRQDLQAARIRSDGTVLSTAVLQTGTGQSIVAAATKSGFVVVGFDRATTTTIDGFDRSLRQLFRSPYNSASRVTIASDGGDRVILGLFHGQGTEDLANARVLRLNDRGTLLWLATGAMLNGAWSASTFLACHTRDCVLFNGDDGFVFPLDLPHFPLPPHDGDLFLATENGRPTGLYARRIAETDGTFRTRMFSRTFSVLPKGASAP